MSDKATKKATAATSEAMDEVFHEAMRSYEKALKSGIRLREESVNLWKSCSAGSAPHSAAFAAFSPMDRGKPE